jgi:addiction module RelB/DinJ family antitoxin
MPRTAELKIRIDPELKNSATELYGKWGLNLTDAVTIFLSQSVATGGLPFAMCAPAAASAFDWNHPGIIRKDLKSGHAVLPSEWDSKGDSVYDSL